MDAIGFWRPEAKVAGAVKGAGWGIIGP